eukprot:364552-Chlamydomonas_euryale.AAC.2
MACRARGQRASVLHRLSSPVATTVACIHVYHDRLQQLLGTVRQVERSYHVSQVMSLRQQCWLCNTQPKTPRVQHVLTYMHFTIASSLHGAALKKLPLPASV